MLDAKIETRKRMRYSSEIQPAVFVYQLDGVSALDGRLSRLQNSKILAWNLINHPDLKVSMLEFWELAMPGKS